MQTNNRSERPNKLISTILGAMTLAACLAIGVSSIGAQTYSVTDLGVLPGKKISTPAAINDLGQITGTSSADTASQSAFRYDGTKKESMEDVGKYPDGSISRGFGINSLGVVVGDSTFAEKEFCRAAIFSNGSITDLGFLKPGGNYSRANGINASNEVVGFSSAQLDSTDSRAFIWSKSTGMLDLGTLGGEFAQAFAINDAGFVTGNSEIANSKVGARHAFLYQPFSATEGVMNPMRDLGTLGGRYSYGTFVNVNNQVVGYSTINDSGDRIHAFIYDGTKMRDLGSLGGEAVESDQSFALGVNASEQVVGYTYRLGRGIDSSSRPTPEFRQVAFIFHKDAMLDLNELIGTEAKNHTLYSATAINEQGQIVANALENSSGAIHAVLLTPVASSALAVRGPAPIDNTVTIKSAEYDKKYQILLIQASITGESASGAWATVEAYYPNGELIGTLSSMGNSTYMGKWAPVENNPMKIVVTSSLGGSATSEVTEVSLVFGTRKGK